MEKTFSSNSQTQEQFIQNINIWLSQNPNIKINRMYTAESGSIGLFVNKTNVSGLTLIYEQDNTQTSPCFFTVIEKMSLMKIDLESMKNSWLAEHPNCEVVCCNYYHNVRGTTGSILLNGFMGMNRNQLRIIYRQKHTSAAAVNSNTSPTVSNKRFCTTCGNSISTNDKFCQKCGNKLA